MSFNFFGVRLVMVVCLSIQMSGVVQSSGILELNMMNFRNPSEKLRDGSKCDPFGFGQCDNIFHFGLDISAGSTNDPQSNFYFTKVTGTYQGENDVNFDGDQMNGVNNPIKWEFETVPESVLFKVYIEDEDASSNDYLDGMVERLTLTPAHSEPLASSKQITIYGLREKDKTTLSMTYKCYCKDHYYGPTCSVYCEDRDADIYGHYTCDPFTGAKLCRPGYKNPSGDCKDKS